jgi:hypothetical protein
LSQIPSRGLNFDGFETTFRGRSRKEGHPAKPDAPQTKIQNRARRRIRAGATTARRRRQSPIGWSRMRPRIVEAKGTISGKLSASACAIASCAVESPQSSGSRTTVHFHSKENFPDLSEPPPAISIAAKVVAGRRNRLRPSGSAGKGSRYPLYPLHCAFSSSLPITTRPPHCSTQASMSFRWQA